jgi:hypothetical protein
LEKAVEVRGVLEREARAIVIKFGLLFLGSS